MLSLDTDAFAMAALASRDKTSCAPSARGAHADADMMAESVKLIALRIKQQLAIQAPTVLVSLFRLQHH